MDTPEASPDTGPETAPEAAREPAPESAAMLTFAEARVLGCLLEKEITTPDYYPLTLAALTAACNQKSNRSPVVEWDEKVVEAAMEGLRRKRFGVMISMSGARGPKYKHTLDNVLGGFDPGMTAVLCELLLRNVQTVSELRTRTERMHPLPSLEAVEDCALKLVNYPVSPLATVIPPGSGRRVKAYAHLLCGPVDFQAPALTTAAVELPPPEDWKAKVEAELAALRSEVERLKAMMPG
jgi:uncharacterized protein YceH (UPF0502 family)